MEFNTSVFFSGNVIGLKRFQKPLYYGYKKTPPDKSKPVQKQDSKGKSFARAKANLRLLINSNFGELTKDNRAGQKSVKFLTLTFAEPRTSRQAYISELVKFIDRLEYFLGEKIIYVCVPEVQYHRKEVYNETVLHFHLLLYCSFIPWKTCIDLWGQGSAFLRRVRDIYNIGNYVAKYLSKDFACTDKFQKSYFSSQGLKDKTKKIRFFTNSSYEDTKFLLDFWVGDFIIRDYERVFESEWGGQINIFEATLHKNYHTRKKHLIDYLHLYEEKSPQD